MQSDSSVVFMDMKYCSEENRPLTFDCKHSMTEIFEVNSAMSVGIQVLCKLLHLKKREKDPQSEKGNNRVTLMRRTITCSVLYLTINKWESVRTISQQWSFTSHRSSTRTAAVRTCRRCQQVFVMDSCPGEKDWSRHTADTWQDSHTQDDLPSNTLVKRSCIR